MVTTIKSEYSLEDFIANPPEDMEWVDGRMVEKNGMTLRHGKVQLKLGSYWRNYIVSNQPEGEVYINVHCQTKQRVRCADVAYLTPKMVNQFGNVATLPQSFPLVAEIVSPTDIAEEVLLKAQEYLSSGCLEVWLVYPESGWVMVLTESQGLMFTGTQVVSTQLVMTGFSITVAELLA